MTRYEIDEDIKNMKNASCYFQEFMQNNLADAYTHWNKDSYLHEIKSKLYFILNNGSYIKDGRRTFINEDDLLKLIETFQYISIKIVEEKNIKFESKDITAIYSKYKELVQEISNYYFISHGENSYGATQTRANSDILIYLFALKGLLIDALKELDSFLKLDTSISDEKNLKNDLLNKLEIMLGEMDNTVTEASQARDKYHENWDLSCRTRRKYRTVFHSDLGRLKKEWRLNKNKACRMILNTYEEIINLNKQIDDYFKLNKKSSENMSKKYQYFMERLTKSPNYYCFLTQEEIEKISEENKTKKLERKQRS